LMLTTHDDTYTLPCETDSNNSPTSNHVYIPSMGASRAKEKKNQQQQCSKLKTLKDRKNAHIHHTNVQKG
jgi:hypothetical protein